MPKKVALGLSGGVDSAVAGALLLEQGYEVSGVFILCYSGPGCRSDADRKDALDVALKLGISFEVLDYRQAFQDTVMDYFKSEYAAGRTPNPDVLCNKEIKFGLFYEWAMKQGYDAVATGHYARIQKSKTRTLAQKSASEYTLLRAFDEKKDQSYFLYQLREAQLAHILFPLGEMSKQAVREKARELSLNVAEKKDSVGICFVGDVSVPQFLRTLGLEEKEGDVVDATGKRIGSHRGAWFVTIGQRHGFGIQVGAYKGTNLLHTDLPPLYVITKDIEKNQLTVGTREAAMRQEFEVDNAHFVKENDRRLKENSEALRVRIRHGGKLLEFKAKRLTSTVAITLQSPEFGVAPGQAAVFYKEDEVIGGGIIT